MSTNQGPEYFAAEKRYLTAETMEQRIFYLEEMIHNFKKHKGSENMLAELKKRLIKLKDKKEKSKKVGKTTQKTIKKEGFQAVLLGLPNSGKSLLISKLTNAHPIISEIPFSTKSPEIGTLFYKGAKVQIVDTPSIGSECFDIGLINTADLVIEVVESIEDLDKIKNYLAKANGKKIILINKSDLLSQEELRKLEEKIKSKKIQAILISALTSFNLESVKERIFQSMGILRVYTKEPGKKSSNIPMTLPLGSTVKDAAESILKGFSQKIKETRITGPSSKFPNQKVGLSHVLKDLDIIEFHTK